MDKKELYKLLHDHYDLIPDVDWWQHKQSKNWIITHNGVKKLASQPTIQGYTIHPPTAKDIIVFKDGSEGGIFGNEVVMGGDFTLKNKDNKVIRTAFRTGEANSLNVSKHVGYPWAMAEKRMFDRGVLDLLSFAELNVYSEIEAETFNKKNGSKLKLDKTPTPKPAVVEAVAPAPKLPPKPTVKPSITPPVPEKKTENIEAKPSKAKDSIINMVATNDSGVSKSQMCDQIDATKEEINEAINELMEKDCIYKTGERRGTKYHLKVPNVSEEKTEAYIAKQQSNEAPLTKAEYTVLWREASESLRAKGIGYSQMMTIVNQVTGHDTAISAFNANALSKEHIAEIRSIGAQLSA